MHQGISVYGAISPTTTLVKCGQEGLWVVVLPHFRLGLGAEGEERGRGKVSGFIHIW